MTRPRTLSWDVSTQTLPDAYERYVVGIADMHDVSDVSDHDRLNFFNISRSTVCTAGGVGEGHCVPHTLIRGPEVLRRSEIDGLGLVINEAATSGEYGDRSVKAPPRALQFRDLGRPATTRFEAVELISIMIPRNLAPPSLLGPAMHGLAIPASEAGVRLIRRQMRALVDEAEHLSDRTLDAGIQAILLIAARVVGVEAPIEAPQLAALRNTVKRAAVDHIEDRFLKGDALFDIDLLARTVGVSRATLYRAFDEDGGVIRYVQDRRLHYARMALRRRKVMNRTIADIAYDHGFASPNHFSRLFRARYGYPPSEVDIPDAKYDVAMPDSPIRHDLMSAFLGGGRTRFDDEAAGNC